jgi:hypothetical protein
MIDQRFAVLRFVKMLVEVMINILWVGMPVKVTDSTRVNARCANRSVIFHLTRLRTLKGTST